MLFSLPSPTLLLQVTFFYVRFTAVASDIFSLSSSHGFFSSLTVFSILKVFSKFSKLAQPVDSIGSDDATSHGLTGGSIVFGGSVLFQAKIT